MFRIIIISFIIFSITSCKTVQKMTAYERVLIQSEAENIPFRVLQVTESKDNKVLRTACKNIDFVKDKRLLDLLISRLKATMAAESGVGIAAPQVGISRNVFLFMRIDKADRPIEVAINPKIISKPDETICFEGDGCLSIPDTRGNSIRYPWIEVEYINESGQLVREKLTGYSRVDDFTSIIFQHEFDHLQGVLFTDKLCESTPKKQIE
ncbi:MAG TPA: peptide deformylase [Saprospiraceae bacterium]|nr:peptide deformylase [Saprospiraceae bacterium]